MTEEESARAIWLFSAIFVTLGLLVASNFYFDRFFGKTPGK
jgi:hypothetical protein